MTDVTTEAPARRRNPRGQGERLRDDLLEAALELMSRHGDPEDLSIRAVAKAVGVTPTAVYRHFADRDELVVAACEENFEQFRVYLANYFTGIDDPFERLLAAGRGYLAFARHDPGRYRVLFSNPLSQSADPKTTADILAGDTAFTQLVDLVTGCIEAGARPLHDDPVYLSFQIWTWLHGIVDLRITHPGMDWPDAEEMAADIARVLRLDRPADETTR